MWDRCRDVSGIGRVFWKAPYGTCFRSYNTNAVSPETYSGLVSSEQLGISTQSMTAQAAKTVAAAFISSRLDYCNSLLYGLPDTLLRKLQSVQNTTMWLITGTRRCDHITLVLRELHWLPIRERVKFKVACLVRQSLSRQAPLYLADDCCLVSDSTLYGQLTFRLAWCQEHTAVTATQLLQPLDLTCGTLFRSSCAIQASGMDCLDDSWRDIFSVNHERGALWLLDMWRLRKTLTYLLTYPGNTDSQNTLACLDSGYITSPTAQCHPRCLTEAETRWHSTPSMPAVPNCCCSCSKGSAPYWSNPTFLIFDIRALWRPVLSARAPECQKLKMLG